MVAIFDEESAVNRVTLGPSCPCCRMARAWWPAGMASGGSAVPDGPAPSFLDEVAKQPSAHALAGDENTRDLFEHVDADRWVVIRGATVLPMTKDERLPDCDVLIRNGVIDAVKPSGSAVPAGARVIDAKGKFVIPGLSDLHTHPMLLEWVQTYAQAIAPTEDPNKFLLPYDLQMFLFLAAGVTRTEILMGTVEELTLRDSVRSGRIRGPAMRVSSPLIDGFPAMYPPAMSWVVGDADGARRAAQTIVDRGFDFAKPYTRLSREAFTVLASECERLGIPMMGHVPAAVGAEDAMAMGQRGIAHVFEFFYNDPPEKKHDLERLARYARLARQHGAIVQGTLCIANVTGYEWPDVQKDPRLHQTLEPLVKFIFSDEATFNGMFRSMPDRIEAVRGLWDSSKRMTQALLAEGMRVLPGTDLSGSDVTEGLSMHEELRLYVEEIGVKPIESLRLATAHAAEYQGEAGRAGQIASGQRSDLVILDQDPTVDIRATRCIDTVILGRHLLSRQSRERGIARAKQIYSAMPVPQPAS